MTTLKVEILGTGCKKCQQLEANAKVAIGNRQLEAEVAHITDTMEIVNGQVLSQGKLLEPDAIAALLPS